MTEFRNFFSEASAQILSQNLSKTDYFLQSDHPQSADTDIFRAVRCRITQQPKTSIYSYFDDNQIETANCEGCILLSLSMNPIMQIQNTSTIMALNLAFTKIQQFDLTDFTSLQTFSVKGCYYLKQIIWNQYNGFADVQQTRISVKPKFARVLFDKIDNREIYNIMNENKTDLEQSYEFILQWNQRQYQDICSKVDLLEFRNKLIDNIYNIENDIQDLLIVQKQREVSNQYISSEEQDIVIGLLENKNLLTIELQNLTQNIKEFYQNLEFELYVKNLPFKSFFDTLNINVLQLDRHKYSVENQNLYNIAIRLCFEGVEIQNNRMMFDPLEFRNYLKDNTEIVYVKIQNSNIFQFLAEGYQHQDVTIIYNNEVVLEETSDSYIQSRKFFVQKSQEYIVIPDILYLSYDLLDQKRLVESSQQLKNKNLDKINIHTYERQPILSQSSFEQTAGDRLVFSAENTIDLHNIESDYPDNVGEIISQILDIKFVNLSFNNLKQFIISSETINSINLSKNCLEIITINCPQLKFLDLSFNKLSFINIFSGISQQTKNSISFLNYQGNLFQNKEFILFTQIIRYFKQILAINGIQVSQIQSFLDNYLGISQLIDFTCYDVSNIKTELIAIKSQSSHSDCVNLENQAYLVPPIDILNMQQLLALNATNLYKFQVQYLKKFINIRQLCLANCEITTNQFAQIDLSQLQYLDLSYSNCNINSKKLQSVKVLYTNNINNVPEQVEILGLSGQNFNTEQLLKFNKLTHLMIDVQKIEDFLFLLPDLRQINDNIITNPIKEMKIQQLTSSVNSQILKIRRINDDTLDLQDLGLTSLNVEVDIQHLVKGVKALYAQNNNIVNLQGIEYFPNLQLLNVNQNQITDPFNIVLNHNSIKTLYINANPVKSLKNNNFVAPITILELQKTQIKSLIPAQFSFLSKLQKLDISYNSFLNVSKDALSNLPQLRQLNISNAARDLDITLQVRQQLTVLICESCKISNFSQIENFVYKATNLQVLICKNNPFCLKYSKLQKSYVYDILKCNLQLQRVDNTEINETDRQKIIIEREQEEQDKQNEISMITMGPVQPVKRVSSAKPVLQQRVPGVGLGIGGVKIHGIGVPKQVLRK